MTTTTGALGTLSSSGIGSGLDINGLVQQLVNAEKAPKTALLDQAEAGVQAKVSALGSLRSALDAFRSSLSNLENLDSFRGRSVTQSGTDYLAATAAASAVPGSYEVSVDQLATSQKLASRVFASTTDPVGTGTLTIVDGADAFSVSITDQNSSLTDIAAAINEAADNPGVVAAVINGVDGAQLVLSSTSTGADHGLVVTQSGGDGGLAALTYDPANGQTNLTELQAPQNAKVTIDGIAVESSSNSIGDAIGGLSLDLQAPNTSGDATRVTVGYDRQGAGGTIDSLVKAYNALMDAISSVSSYDPQTQQGGPLFGDAGVSNLGYQLRRELTGPVDGAGPFHALSDIGLSVQLDGKLQLDGTKLDAAFAQNFDAVGQLFANAEQGVANRMDSLLDPYLKGGGIFDLRSDGYKSTLSDISDQRQALDTRLQAYQSRLLSQFNALDTLMAQLQSTSNFLTQQLANLPGSGSLITSKQSK